MNDITALRAPLRFGDEIDSRRLALTAPRGPNAL